MKNNYSKPTLNEENLVLEDVLFVSSQHQFGDAIGESDATADWNF